MRTLSRPVKTAGSQLVSRRLTRWLLLAFVALFPLLEGYSNADTPIGTTNSGTPIGTTLFGAAVFVVWALENAIGGSTGFRRPALLMIAFGAWNGVSLLWTDDIPASLARLGSLLPGLVLYLCVQDTIRTPRQIRQLALAYVFGVAALAVSAVPNVLFGHGYAGYYNRFSAMGSDPNNFGMMLVSTVPLALLLTWDRLILRAVGIAYVLGAVMLTLATASRGALIALVLIGVVVTSALLRRRRTRLWAILILATGVLAVTFAAYVVPEQALARLAVSSIGDDAFGGRSAAWKLALDMGSSQPMTGHGTGTFYFNTSRTMTDGIYAHNTFLLAFAELGIPGVVLWSALWIVHFVGLWGGRRVDAEPDLRVTTFAVGTALLVVLVAAATLNWEVRKPLYLLWGLAAACQWARGVRRGDRRIPARVARGGVRRLSPTAAPRYRPAPRMAFR